VGLGPVNPCQNEVGGAGLATEPPGGIGCDVPIGANMALVRGAASETIRSDERASMLPEGEVFASDQRRRHIVLVI
jgi:hypothetical protein